MPTIEEKGYLPIVSYYYPPGCLPSESIVYVRDLSQRSFVIRPVDHRPYPNDVTKNLTSRELAYDQQASYGIQYKPTFYGCPHGGIHGIVEARFFNVGLASGGFEVFSNDELNSTDWASRLRSEVSKDKYNLGGQVAEYRETVKLFLGTVKVIHNAYKGIRRGDFSVFRNRKLNDIPASVLAYNFGVAPLVEDVYSTAEILHARMNKPLSRRLSVSTKLNKRFEINSGGFNHQVSGTLSNRATIYYDIDPSFALSQDFDFGNPVEWAWELIPFSFVIDWMIPIGDWLGTLDAMFGTANVRGTVTQRVRHSYTAQWDQATVTVSNHSGWFRSHRRSVISGVPLPPPPRWKVSTSYRSLLNAVSLLGVLRLK
jgi:hypothetical protein